MVWEDFPGEITFEFRPNGQARGSSPCEGKCEVNIFGRDEESSGIFVLRVSRMCLRVARTGRQGTLGKA